MRHPSGPNPRGYLEDLRHWYKRSYGTPLNARMVCPLHHHLLHELRQRAQGESERAAALMFAHGETLLRNASSSDAAPAPECQLEVLTASLSLPQCARRNDTGSLYDYITPTNLYSDQVRLPVSLVRSSASSTPVRLGYTSSPAAKRSVSVWGTKRTKILCTDSLAVWA